MRRALAVMVLAGALACAGGVSNAAAADTFGESDGVVLDAPTAVSAAGLDARVTHCGTFNVKEWRDGVFGGRLWTYSVTGHVCWNGSSITGGSGNNYVVRKGTGSLTWDYLGLFDSSRWGGSGSNRVGWYQEAGFASSIVHATDSDYPTISMTIYGDGHWTHNQSCGC